MHENPFPALVLCINILFINIVLGARGRSSHTIPRPRVGTLRKKIRPSSWCAVINLKFNAINRKTENNYVRPEDRTRRRFYWFSVNNRVGRTANKTVGGHTGAARTRPGTRWYCIREKRDTNTQQVRGGHINYELYRYINIYRPSDWFLRGCPRFETTNWIYRCPIYAFDDFFRASTTIIINDEYTFILSDLY